MPVGADYTIKKGRDTLAYKISFGEYQAWLAANKNYKVSRIEETNSAYMIHYTVFVKENK